MKKFAFVAAALLAPSFASAAAIGSSISSLLALVTNTVGALVYIVMSLGLLTFLWGVVKYVISSSDDDKKTARQYMIWGIIGLFVMASVWGIVGLLQDSVFGTQVNVSVPPSVPKIPIPSSAR